jgi:MoaA/NifB/PqqE/SkfB family radical SAM enzyme
MSELLGKQLYGLDKLLIKLKIATNKELKGLSIKKKLALGSIFDENKITKVGDRVFINTFIPYYPSVAYDRFLRNMVNTGKGERYPNIANIAVTGRCICKCWHCSYSDRIQRAKSNDLSTEEIKKMISELQDIGTCIVGLTGGEPLLRKDLEEIIASIDERSMPIMFTTGYKLDKARVHALKEAGLAIAVISLDHYTPEIHDKGRGVDGMYDYAVKAIELFKSENIYTAVSFVPNRELISNMNEVDKCLELFKSLGVNDMRLTSPILSGNLKAKPEELLTEADVANVFKVQKKCVKTKGLPGVFAYDYFESKKFYGCGAGFNFLFIDSEGNACPCDFTSMSFGNVKETSIKDIWKQMSDCFCTPGCECYASKIHKYTSERPSESLPLNLEESLKVHAECPSYDKDDIPDFFRKLGVK